MDAHQQQKSTQASARKRSIVTPPYNGRRQLAFRIRRRGFTFEGGPSLLIIDRDGIWSVAHRRYIRTTRHRRFHGLKAELDPVRAGHEAWVRRFGLDTWPQYAQDEDLRSLRRKLAGFYWGVMPGAEKRRTVRFYRSRRRRRRAACFAAAVVCLAVAGFVLLRLVMMGFCGVRVGLVLGSGYLVAAYLLDRAWHTYEV